MTLVGLVAVLVECIDCDDLSIREADAHHELVRSSVVGPRFNGDLSADDIARATASPCGARCIDHDAVLHISRGAAKRLHGRHGLPDLN